MLVKKKIGWQKYEDVIESQIKSPFVDMISNHINSNSNLEQFMDTPEYIDQEEERAMSQKVLVAVPDDIVNEINLTSNFDCWVGHVNFDITPKIRESLSKERGVEVLKVCSRYRFFIGIAKMFDFPDIRKSIEQTLLIDKES